MQRHYGAGDEQEESAGAGEFFKHSQIAHQQIAAMPSQTGIESAAPKMMPRAGARASSRAFLQHIMHSREGEFACSSLDSS